jgi:hypothetical protein
MHEIYLSFELLNRWPIIYIWNFIFAMQCISLLSNTFPTNSFIHHWLYSPLLGPGRFFNFVIYTQSVGLRGRGMSPLQVPYLQNTE